MCISSIVNNLWHFANEWKNLSMRKQSFENIVFLNFIYLTFSHLNQFLTHEQWLVKYWFYEFECYFIYKLFLSKSGDICNTNFQQRFPQHSLSGWERGKF